MYQGKFLSDNKGGTPTRREQTLAQDGSRPASRQTAPRSDSPRDDSTKQRQNSVRPTAQSVSRKRGASVGSTIFYTLYFLLIFVFVVGMVFAVRYVQNWLVAYEASQPTVKSQEVFDQLFANPDWASLYERAGIEDTPYEGVDAYVTYMQEKTAGLTMTYSETSAGTSLDKKYIVKAGDEKVASFTLTGGTEKITDIPDWQLGTVELFFDRAEGYRIQKMSGHTAYVNGAPLDESFTIQISTTKAEEYLPIGTTGVEVCIQQIDGLMARPTVTVNDQSGNAMDVTYDEDSGMFIEQTEANTISDDLKQRCIDAMEAYGMFLLNVGNRGTVASYFDASGEAYQNIMSADRSWTKSGASQKFMNENVTEYVRYSDSVCSARVSMTMTATRSDGTIKEFPIDYTLFFTYKNDKWMVYDMIAGSVQTPVGKVRLTFMDGDTQLSTGFYNTDTTEIDGPVVSVPDGKTLSWVTKSTDENGRQQLTVVFSPGSDGKIEIASGSVLEPMTLYAYLEDAQTEAETETTAEGGEG